MMAKRITMVLAMTMKKNTMMIKRNKKRKKLEMLVATPLWHVWGIETIECHHHQSDANVNQ